MAALLRRNHELECESKARRRETKLLRDNVANLNEKLANSDAQTEQLKIEAEQLKVEAKGLRSETRELKAVTEELKAQLEWFKKQLFGAKSERWILEALSPADQLWLGEQMLELSEQPPADNETLADVEKKGRNKGKRSKKPDRCQDSISSRLHFDDSVPIEEVVIRDPEMEALPKDQVEVIGQDVTYKLGQRSPYLVIKTIRTTWKKKVSCRLACLDNVSSAFTLGAGGTRDEHRSKWTIAAA